MSEGIKSPLRAVAASLLVIVAASHLVVIEDHLQEAPYIGVLFGLLSVAALVLAALLLWRDSRAVWFAAAATCAAAILAFIYSRSLGLPQITDDIGNWTEPDAWIAVVTEALVVVCALLAVGRRAQLAWAGRLSFVVLAAGLASVGVAVASPKGGSDMGSMHGAKYWSQVGGAPFHSTGVTRTYYVEADQVVWNYAPAGKNQITGRRFDSDANVFVKRGPGRIGAKYVKCLYRGYTDGTFAHRTARGSYLGFLGPVIHAVVGDTVKVVYRNRCSIPTSMHPHGVFYDKDSEGAPYADGTSGSNKLDDAVRPGGHHTYTWQVPDRAGPGPEDGSSVMWMYHSHTDEVSDTYAGLMGPIVVTGAGLANPDGTPADVDREVFELFAVMNENASPYVRKNIQRFAPSAAADDDEGFEESNLMHSINGYVFGNQPMLTLRTGQRVRWYVMGMGTEVDLHTPHWHGNDVTVGGMRMDVINLLPASMVVADMVPDDPGTWLFHCHVADHISAGMQARYRVTDS